MTSPPARTIPLNDAVQFDLWAQYLGLTPDQLSRVVKSAGTDVGTVCGYLNWSYQPIRSAR